MTNPNAILITLPGGDFEVRLPATFPEKYREAVFRVIEQCSVKRAIAAQPRFAVRATVDPAPLQDVA